MKARNVGHTLGLARAIGNFSWPVEGIAGGMSSPKCTEIIGAEIGSCVDFVARLTDETRAQQGFGHAVIVDRVSSALDADVEVRFDGDGFKRLVTARTGAALAS